MGQIEISGEQSSLFLQYITTNNIEKMKTGSAQYNLICNHNGGIIDDVIIYKLSNNNFILLYADVIGIFCSRIISITDFEFSIVELSILREYSSINAFAIAVLCFSSLIINNNHFHKWNPLVIMVLLL